MISHQLTHAYACLDPIRTPHISPPLSAKSDDHRDDGDHCRRGAEEGHLQPGVRSTLKVKVLV